MVPVLLMLARMTSKNFGSTSDDPNDYVVVVFQIIMNPPPFHGRHFETVTYMIALAAEECGTKTVNAGQRGQ